MGEHVVGGDDRGFAFFRDDAFGQVGREERIPGLDTVIRGFAGDLFCRIDPQGVETGVLEKSQKGAVV